MNRFQQKLVGMSRNKHWTKMCMKSSLTLIVSTLRLCCYGYPFKMVFSAADKQLIKSLRQLKSYSSSKFLQEFPQRNWTHRGLDWLLAKIGKYVTAERVPCSEWPHGARTADNVATVEELVQSQEDKPQTHRTLRETARETGIHCSSAHQLMMIFES